MRCSTYIEPESYLRFRTHPSMGIHKRLCRWSPVQTGSTSKNFFSAATFPNKFRWQCCRLGKANNSLRQFHCAYFPYIKSTFGTLPTRQTLPRDSQSRRYSRHWIFSLQDIRCILSFLHWQRFGLQSISRKCLSILLFPVGILHTVPIELEYTHQ